jgi:hypothetical protein
MASRKDEKRRLREEREQRERAAAADAQRRRLIAYGGVGALALVAVVVIVVVAVSGGGGGGSDGGSGGGGAVEASAGDFPESPVPSQRIADLDEAASKAGCVTRSFRSEGRQHTPDPVKYKSNPPHSGPHNPVPADDAAYVGAPPTEKLVHSLEHGRVIVHFRPTIEEERKGQLKSLFDEDPYHVLLVPNAKMPYEIAATAWTEVLGCKRAGPAVFDALRAFIRQNRDRGPEFVP